MSKRYSMEQFDATDQLHGESIELPFKDPVAIEIGRTVLYIVRLTDAPTVIQDRLNPLLDGVVYSPSGLNVKRHQGYKGLRNHESVLIGRDEPGRFEDIRQDGGVSRQHVQLGVVDDKFYVSDLHSTNGTSVFRYRQAVSPTEDGPSRRELDTAHGIRIESATRAKDGREWNEDALVHDVIHAVAGVFDGVGGQEGSGKASMTAANISKDVLARTPYISPRSLAILAVKEALEQSHHGIRELNRDIATTATVAKIFYDPGEQDTFAAIASVGDSRAYLYRDAQLSHITLDHTYVIGNESKRGRLQSTFANVSKMSELSPDEQALFRHRNIITSMLGGRDEPMITTQIVRMREGDRLLLTTDGVHDNLTDNEIAHHLKSASPPNSIIEAAVRRSRDQSHMRAKRDDTTAVVMTIQSK